MRIRHTTSKPTLHMAFVALVLLAGSLLVGCEADVVEPTPIPERAERRALLEDALWKPELSYSRKLLSAYGYESMGWELLDEMNERSGPLRLSDAEALNRGEPLPLDGFTSVREGDGSLGETVFNRLPMRGGPWLDWLASKPEHWSAVGLTLDDNGHAEGLVRYQDAFGESHVAVTCGLCHAGGRGNRQINLGLARVLWRESIGASPGESATWGKGRIDVTDDGANTPTAIPDLFGLQYAKYLNSSGVIAVPDLAVLAIRFETQFILGHSLLERPARDLTAALADYVLTLRSGTNPSQPPVAFQTHCGGCHNPDAGFSGGLVPADQLHTDPAVAMGPARGTGFYKVPSLLGASIGGPYFHDGSANDFETVLDLHPQSPLSDTERSDILSFLITL
ncbi:MAG: hypothetical protein ACI9OJ_002866 [Myxococcota bacterium]|jgi:hypothetical protein